MRTDPETRITELLAHANKCEQRMREAERKARRLEAALLAVTAPTAGMAALLDDVRACHEAWDAPVIDTPQWPSQARIDLRLRLLAEEYSEWLEAVMERDLVEVADALAAWS